MIAVPAPSPARLHPAIVQRGFFKLSVNDYHDMIANNILTTDDRVEFLEGYLVQKIPQKSPHASTVIRIDYLFKRMLLAQWIVRAQVPITLTESEPEPDLAVVTGNIRTYDQRHPNASEVRLVIEVADSSLAMDREFKGPIYARAGIPEYWIVNLPDAKVEVYTEPGPGGYQKQLDFVSGQSIPLDLDKNSISISVAELLP